MLEKKLTEEIYEKIVENTILKNLSLQELINMAINFDRFYDFAGSYYKFDDSTPVIVLDREQPVGGYNNSELTISVFPYHVSANDKKFEKLLTDELTKTNASSVQSLKESDFVDLLVSIGYKSYGDYRAYEYFDEKDRRNVHLWDNCGCFKDRGEYRLWINDFETSNPNLTFSHNLFMLETFGQSWYERAQKYFTDKGSLDNLILLDKVKKRYDEELAIDAEFIEHVERSLDN